MRSYEQEAAILETLPDAVGFRISGTDFSCQGWTTGWQALPVRREVSRCIITLMVE